MAVLISMLVPVLFIVYHVNFKFKKYFKEDFIASTTREIVQIDNAINMYLNTIKENVEFLASDEKVIKSKKVITNYLDNKTYENEEIEMTPSKNGEIEENIYEFYSKFGKNHSELEYIFMGTEDGGFIQWPEGKIKKGYDPRIRPWYKNAIKNKGITTLVNPYYYPSGDIAIISIARTIENSNKEIIGVQAVDISLSKLTNIIKNIKIGNEGYIILVDNTGMIMAHSQKPQLNFKNIKELNIDKLSNINNIQSDSFEIELDDKIQLANIYTSPETKWKFIAVVEKTELLEYIGVVESDILNIVIIFIFLALVMASILSYRFSNPILAIEKQFKYISLGEFSNSIPKNVLERKDELGSLSMALNRMKEQLKKLIEEIKKSEGKVKESFSFLQTLIDTIPSPIFSKDEKGVYNHCNNAMAEYLGLKKEEIIGKTVYDVYEKELADVYYEADSRLMKEKGTQTYGAQISYNDGTLHHVTFNEAAIVSSDNSFKGLVGVIVDITEDKKNKDKIDKLLRLKEAMLQVGYSVSEISCIKDLLSLILETAIDSIEEDGIGSVLVLDEDNKLKIAVAKGYDEDKVKEFSIGIKKSFAWTETNGNIESTIILNNVDEMKGINPLNTSDGTIIKSVITAPIFIDENLYGFLNIDSKYNNVFDETDFQLMEYMRRQVAVAIGKHKLYEETIYLSRYDKLTNVFNRSYFEELIYTDLSKKIIDKEQFYVVIYDLNGLKFANDNYGHLAGDLLIKTFAKQLSSCAKEADIIARLGGDEFIGVFFNTDIEKLIDKFEKLSYHFSISPLKFEKNSIICNYSYGIASFPNEAEEFDQLIKLADKRMYEYKKIIKNKMQNN